jgi:hypothetical protein
VQLRSDCKVIAYRLHGDTRLSIVKWTHRKIKAISYNNKRKLLRKLLLGNYQTIANRIKFSSSSPPPSLGKHSARDTRVSQGHEQCLRRHQRARRDRRRRIETWHRYAGAFNMQSLFFISLHLTLRLTTSFLLTPHVFSPVLFSSILFTSHPFYAIHFLYFLRPGFGVFERLRNNFLGLLSQP